MRGEARAELRNYLRVAISLHAEIFHLDKTQTEREQVLSITEIQMSHLNGKCCLIVPHLDVSIYVPAEMH
jgi:hypothetical protein